jgi:hypothetical protein
MLGVEVLVPLGMLLFAAVIVYIVVSTRHKERMELIHRGINPNRPETPSTGTKSLLWGMIFAALGLAGIIYFIVLGRIEDSDMLFFAIAGFVAGGALLLYHKLTAPQRERAMNLYEKHLEAMSAKVQSAATVKSEEVEK